jgi:nitrogen regulatory protein P-II 1
MQDDTNLGLKRPVSVWNKPLKVDFAELFASLSKSVVYGVGLQWSDAGAELAQLPVAIGVSEDISEVAYLLIRKSLDQAISDLVRVSAEFLSPCAEENLARLAGEIQSSLEAAELSIDATTLENPATLSILPQLQAVLQRWLEIHNVDSSLSQILARDLPSRYIRAFHREWLNNATRYEPILRRLISPSSKTLHLDLAWSAYSAWLSELLLVPIPGHSLLLQQVLVPLNALQSRGDPVPSSLLSRNEPGRPRPLRVLELQASVLDWLRLDRPQSGLRIIAGPPGSGKSTAAKGIAVAANEQKLGRVLFLEHLLADPGQGLDASIEAYIKTASVLPADLAASVWEEKRVILIIDSSERAPHEMDRLLHAALLLLDIGNQRTFKLNILLTVDQSWADLQGFTQVPADTFYKLLPYFVPETERSHLADPQALLAKDLRLLWWEKFAAALGDPRRKQPPILHDPKLQPFTVNPRLNFWMSLIHEELSRYESPPSINHIFAAFLRRIFDSQLSASIHRAPGITFEQFEQTLTEAAWLFWHNSWRPLDYDPTNNRRPDPNQLLVTGVSAFRLLPIVYQTKTNGSFLKAYFTHPAFGEFLITQSALALLRTEALTASPEALTNWWLSRFGPTPLSPEIVEVFKDAIERLGEPEARSRQSQLTVIFQWLLDHQFSKSSGNPPSDHSISTLRNAAEAALAILSLCASVTRQPAEIRWPARTSAGSLLNVLQGQRSGRENTTTLRCLAWINFTDCVLDVHDLFKANLEHAILTRAKLLHAFLAEANLHKALLSGAKLSFARLQDANLSASDLSNLDAYAARFDGANLQHAFAQAMKARKAVFRGANLKEARFHWADLHAADFSGCDLRRTDFTGANLSAARFQNANLEEAVFCSAILQDADLTGALNRDKADFSGAELAGSKDEHGVHDSGLVKVEAIIKTFKLESVKEALVDLGCAGMTVTEVRGKGVSSLDLIPGIKIEVVIEQSMANDIIASLRKAAVTGKRGDGVIFVIKIEQAIRIGTNERGIWAVSPCGQPGFRR